MPLDTIASPDMAVKTYIANGDDTPPAEQLRECYEHISSAQEVYYRLAAADVALDLATIDSTDTSAHLGQAEEQLETAVESYDRLVSRGEPPRFNAVALSAILRLTELPQWREATTANSINFNYEDILKGAIRAIPYANSRRAGASLTEFIPILLIGRANQNTIVGRLALQREDRRPKEVADVDANWDVGISQSGNYIKPEAKIQLKGKTKNAQAYLNAGIPVLRAPEAGIISPFQVINSCLKEYDASAISRQGRNPNMKRFLTSDELDDITAKVLEVAEA